MRPGYPVFADQSYGHGFARPPAYGHGFGGPVYGESYGGRYGVAGGYEDDDEYYDLEGKEDNGYGPPPWYGGMY